MTTWLIAPPGTRVGEPGWYRPPMELALSWGIGGVMPPYAVTRNGVMLSTGLPGGPVVTEFSWPEDEP